MRYLEGASGIRTALFETLDWHSPLRGVLSMRDLLNVPDVEAMEEYIAGRRQRQLWLHVLRSPEKDLPGGWPSSIDDYRHTRYMPAKYVFTMPTIIGDVSAAMISSRRENFALLVESLEYVEMQRNLHEVLWAVAARNRTAVSHSARVGLSLLTGWENPIAVRGSRLRRQARRRRHR
nr:hypothetical protein [Mycobacterium tilburgii]